MRVHLFEAYIMAEDEQRPVKRAKLLLDDDSDGAPSDASGGVALTLANGHDTSGHFKINEQYARRFEHNQKRVELHRCKAAKLVIELMLMYG